VEQEELKDPGYATSLAKIRRRRWFLWGIISIYIPASAAMLQSALPNRGLVGVFSAWFILLCLAVTLLACSKCPRCGNNFHMRNSTLSFFRNCCHCGLHIGGEREGV
jgi:hypothetical protein